MKTSKLFLLSALLVALCMGVHATAELIPGNADSNILAGVISRPAGSYHDGDVIAYSATVAVPAQGTGYGNTCRQENVDVQVTLPNGTVIDFGTIPILDPGDFVTFDSGDDSRMNYTIIHADEGGTNRVTAVLFAESEIAHVSEDDLDTATLTRDIGTTVLHPGIQILKQADPTAICLDVETEITYTYQVSWAPGANGILHDVTALDDTCGPLVRQSDNPGDDDDMLELDEVWEYECTTTISTTTTNRVDVSGEDSGGTQVTDFAEATVTANAPPEVSVDPDAVEICELDEVILCAVVTPDTGTPPFQYEWTKVGDATVIGTDICLTVSEAGEYCVKVIDDAGCDDTACSLVTVIPQPECSFDNPTTSICEEGIGTPVQYCTLAVADHYEWEVMSGPGSIPGDYQSDCVNVVPTGLGTIVLELRVWNDVAPDGSCGNSCQISILVEECGGAFCTFTQGYYGNAGGKKCGGLKTPALIDALLGAGGPVVVGLAGHSITLGTSKCIIDLLPAGGTADVLPAGDFGCPVGALTAIPDSILKDFSKKESRFNNVLIGQIVALTLNLRLFDIDCIGEGGTGNLAGWALPAEFCTMGKDGCVKKHTAPDGFVGMTAAEILALANDVIGGEDVGLSPSEINGAVSFFNETFDECVEVVTCPIDPVEICDNGCDDDFDGDVDLDDTDCAAI
jgi:hypothetical protein